MDNIRLKCAKVIQKTLEDRVFFSELKKSIPENDLPFANMLILTSLRYWTGLDFVLKKFVTKKIPHKHILAEFLLKTAAAEILFMDTAPYAVINQTVQNVKQNCDKFLGGLANAVLRKIAAQKSQILSDIENICLIPQNFLPLLQGYTAQQIQQISDSIKNPAPLDITVKDNHLNWQREFSAQILPNGTLRLQNYSAIQSLPKYTKGEWWVQDVAAALPVALSGDIQNRRVIDLCAAPGGKTAQLAAKGAKVTALDISASRLQTLKQNMARLGFENVTTIAADAIEYMQQCHEKYDMILLDAPCSASGTFRRHPEVLHIKNINDVNEQKLIQQKMLNLCANILKKDGILIYSVCSICPAEGEEQIAQFLSTHSEFARLKITPAEISAFGNWSNDLINNNGEIRTLPYYLKSQKGMDSFFICKLKRII